MLKMIQIKNYRNIKNFSYELSPTANLVIASNGSGKTNLLEAIHYSVFGESFKPLAGNDEFIGPGGEFAKVTTKWDLDTLEVTTSNINNVLNRNFSLNQKKYPITKISSKFPIILFAPHTVDIVIGEPATRRLDLNDYLSIILPEYKKQLSKYQILLKNRNAVLKQIREGRISRDLLVYWTNEIIKTSTEIYKERHKYFADIRNYFVKANEELQSISEDKIHLNIEYIPNLNAEPDHFNEALKNKFETNIEKEIIVGKTLYGIHKDDFSLLMNNEHLKYKGSRGQQRIGILLLKIVQLLYYYEKYNKYPLLLLDDLMSELDQSNRVKVSDYLLSKNIQFIITTADENEIPDNLKHEAKLLVL